MSLAEFLRA